MFLKKCFEIDRVWFVWVMLHCKNWIWDIIQSELDHLLIVCVRENKFWVLICFKNVKEFFVLNILSNFVFYNCSIYCINKYCFHIILLFQ